jgi:hypothetical protein
MLLKQAGLTVALIACLAGSAAARDFQKHAAAAAQENQPAVTVFVDVDFGRRKDSAADALTRVHRSFAQHGYVVVNVESFSENGDLQGFFVTYRRERA